MSYFTERPECAGGPTCSSIKFSDRPSDEGRQSDGRGRRVRRDRPVAMSSTALPKRSTRGRRMNKLLEDEDSADEEFWGQDAFAEEEGDGVYAVSYTHLTLPTILLV